jgi:hypothetical protein
MRVRKALLIGVAAALAIGGVAAGLTIARGDALPEESSEVGGMQPVSVFRPPATESVPLAPTVVPAGPAWTLAKVMRVLDGATLTVGEGRVRINSETMLCSGSELPRRTSGAPRWHTFDCTYTVFTGRIDRDLEFRVDVFGKTAYRVRDIRSIGGR